MKIPINSLRSAHIINLINWLLNDVYNSGGDGDALWYTTFYSLDDIEELILETKDSFISYDGYKFFDKYKMIRDNRGIIIGDQQELLHITDNKDVYDTRPSFIQPALIY